MEKNEIIINLVKDHFNFTFEGNDSNDRKIIFIKDEFRSKPKLMNNISEQSIQDIKSEYLCFLKLKES